MDRWLGRVAVWSTAALVQVAATAGAGQPAADGSWRLLREGLGAGRVRLISAFVAAGEEWRGPVGGARRPPAVDRTLRAWCPGCAREVEVFRSSAAALVPATGPLAATDTVNVVRSLVSLMGQAATAAPSRWGEWDAVTPQVGPEPETPQQRLFGDLLAESLPPAVPKSAVQARLVTTNGSEDSSVVWGFSILHAEAQGLDAPLGGHCGAPGLPDAGVMMRIWTLQGRAFDRQGLVVGVDLPAPGSGPVLVWIADRLPALR